LSAIVLEPSSGDIWDKDDLDVQVLMQFGPNGKEKSQMTTHQCCLLCFVAVAVLSVASDRAFAQTSSPSPLQFEGKIPLGDVRGRIDHMAIDLPRRRLFVVELGNDTVGVVDLNERKVLHVIAGLKEPQGVGYVSSSDMLFIANAGDGSVPLFRGVDYEAAGRIGLGDDADNVRVDTTSNQVFIGYGSGALAVIDAATNGKIADMQLKAHPESFQLARSLGRIFVNVPKAREIAVIDRAAGKQIASWAVGNDSNFPMALDENVRRVLVAFRSPPQLGVFSMRDGSTIATVEACGDADDLFVDAKRHRVYLSCGDGHLDVFDTQGDAYRRAARISTRPGARTSLFVPEIDRLFVAARANPGEPAAVWVFRPTP
jgi:DNA-binding beta-propeller fold protein YncE